MEQEKTNKPAGIGLVLTAAGSSNRMGGGGKKEYRHLQGLPVLLRSLLPFLDAPSLMHIVITLPDGDQDYVRGLLHQLPQVHRHWSKTITLIAGGAERSASVLRGLQGFPTPPEHVLIHDGARPWVSGALVHRVVQETVRSGACIPVIPATDAMKGIDAQGIIRSHLPRQWTVGAQTPQGFHYRSILSAHRRAAEDSHQYIDDSEIYSRYAGEVYTVPGDPHNTKITYSRDLEQESR